MGVLARSAAIADSRVPRRSRMAEQKTCFVISPIGEEGSETRRIADKVLKYIITPPLSELGYTVSRADEIDESGVITNQIIEKLVSVDLVVADLSERNPNVFYELAVRHSSRKPFIQIIRKGEPLPFDVGAYRSIIYDISDIESVDLAKSQIKSQADSDGMKSGEIENPISVAMDLAALRHSPSASDRNLGEVIEIISDVASAVARVERSIPSALPPLSDKVELIRNQNRRLQALLEGANAEISRLRIIKSKIDFESIDSSAAFEPVLDSIAAILSHVKKHCIPRWEKADAEAIQDDLEEVIQKIQIISLNCDISF